MKLVSCVLCSYLSYLCINFIYDAHCSIRYYQNQCIKQWVPILRNIKLFNPSSPGNKVKDKVRTMASLLVNGTKGTYKRLIVDEALMNHFGSIVMANQLTGANDVILIGDINQLPFIERENLFKLNYTRPNLVTSITQELSCTHRSPMDMTYALSMVYNNIYSSKEIVRSLKLMKYTGARIPKTDLNTLYLVHTQEEKAALTNTGYGSGTDSRVLTIHEAQGLTSPSVIIIQTKSRKLAIHDSVPHAVVAMSRHTNTCVYYTDTEGDAVASFIKRTTEVSTEHIKDYNIKMARIKSTTSQTWNLMKDDMNCDSCRLSDGCLFAHPSWDMNS